MIRPVNGSPVQAPRYAAATAPMAAVPGAAVDQVSLGEVAAPRRQAPPAPPTPLRQAFDALVNMGGPARIQLLDNNEAAWVARWRTVESAQKTLDMQYFTWDHDVFGMALLGHVFKKAREGVATRIMIDATGDTLGTRGFKSHIGGKDYMQELVMTGNVKARVYHPHWKKILDQIVHPLSTAIAASDHDKIVLADKQRGITGGRNIGYEYFANPDDFAGAWRDTDVSFEGRETADALQTAFEVEFGALWITSEVKADRLGNLKRRDAELLGAYLMMDAWVKSPTMHLPDKARYRADGDLREAEAQALVSTALKGLPEEGIDRKLTERELKSLGKLAEELVKYPELRGTWNRAEPPTYQAEVKIVDKTSSVGVDRNQINAAFLDLTRKAQRKIVLENPYVVLTKEIIQALREAGQRGVQIYLGTNSPSSTDSAVTQAFFLSDWPKLEATIPNLHIFVATGERKLHAKVAVADDVLSLVGTYNLDFISERVNSEVAALVWSPEVADQTTSGLMRDKVEDRNAVVEYRILRDAQGTPIRSDGKPVLDAEGNLLHEPEVAFGPDDHVSPEIMAGYHKKMARWGFLRRVLPQLRPLDTFRQVIRD